MRLPNDVWRALADLDATELWAAANELHDGRKLEEAFVLGRVLGRANAKVLADVLSQPDLHQVAAVFDARPARVMIRANLVRDLRIAKYVTEQVGTVDDDREWGAGLFSSEAELSLTSEAVEVLREWAGGRVFGLSLDGWSSESTYAVYLMVWWWRIIAAAWAIAVPGEQPDTNERHAHETLSPEATIDSAASLEPFTTAAQRLIDSPRPSLDGVDESFIRGELEIIRSQHRVVEGADAFYIRRAVGKIVQRLISRQIIGEQARAVLVDLSAEPPDIIEEIVEAMAETMRHVAASWPDARLDPAVDSIGAAEPLAEVARLAGQLEAAAESASLDLAEEAKRKFLLGIPDGAGKTVGASAVGLAGALAVAVSKMPGIDAVVLWLIEAAPRLLDIYTYRSGDDE